MYVCPNYLCCPPRQSCPSDCSLLTVGLFVLTVCVVCQICLVMPVLCYLSVHAPICPPVCLSSLTIRYRMSCLSAYPVYPVRSVSQVVCLYIRPPSVCHVITVMFVLSICSFVLPSVCASFCLSVCPSFRSFQSSGFIKFYLKLLNWCHNLYRSLPNLFSGLLEIYRFLDF